MISKRKRVVSILVLAGSLFGLAACGPYNGIPHVPGKTDGNRHAY